jgi:hypothetical protein
MAALGGPNVVIDPKKVVKKKRGKRVGVASSSSSSSSFLGEASAVDLPDPTNVVTVPDPTSNNDGNGEPWAAPQSQAGTLGNGVVVVVANAPSPLLSLLSLLVDCPTTPGTGTQTNPVFVVEESLPICIKAKWAMDKAEEFIRKKQMRQRTATSSAAKRAMQQRRGLGGGAREEVPRACGRRQTTSPRPRTLPQRQFPLLLLLISNPT